MKLRARGQILPMVVVVVVVLFTLASAGANLIPNHRPTAAELRAAMLEPVIADREARIDELRAVPERCNAARARELTRLLVQGGQWQEARSYANDFEQHCGTDVVVRHWRDAPQPKRYR